MSEARKTILGALRRSLGRPKADADDIAAVASALIADPARYQPKFDDQTNRQRFIARATSERLTATVDEIPDISAAPGAVRGYLAQAGLHLSICQPAGSPIGSLDWGDIEVRHDLTPAEPVVVNVADYAIAETGSLVFTSRPDSPTLYNFLPLHHVILVDGGKILRYSEDYWATVRDGGNVQPRSINLITGTSGTADIEGQNIRGAHGPRFMHIIIYGG